MLSAAGMTLAIATAVGLLARDGFITATGVIVLIAGTLLGAGAGLYSARTVQMTAMPQLVSIFNAVGGGAAALVAFVEVSKMSASELASASGQTTVAMGLDVIIGAVTFSGSLVAAGKLQGVISGQPVLLPGGRLVSAVLALVAVAGAVVIIAGQGGGIILAVVAVAAMGFGILMVLPIGGADMPVVISLLNAFTGTAVAVAGFVLQNNVLIIAGALVGASGTILTVAMAAAMNRSIIAIILGGFGTGDSPAAAAGSAGTAAVRSIAADDAGIQLAYASKVIIVPGYGLAAARAQHEIVELAAILERQGVDVSYAIHPVAGRMPGHMNVLLAEAHVPYPQMKELAEVNPEFAQTDVALVVGANDVTNPAARRPGNAISGMPILDVDHARNVIVIKRSMGHGYAGIENELYTDPRTGMLFADAKSGLKALTGAVEALVH
jgi:NAD(P) transhydrogenase subunit beta